MEAASTDIRRRDTGGVVILSPGERLDVTSAPALKLAVSQAFDGGSKRILLDLAAVQYISSIGLSACLESAKLAQSVGGRITLAGLNTQVAEVFDLTGITRLFEVHASHDLALVALERGSQLSLAEEMLLLALQDESGRFVELPEHALPHALAGAVLMDLCLRQRLDADRAHLLALDTAPLGDDILDPVLAAVADSGPRGADFWITCLAQEHRAIRHRALDRLVAGGILRRENNLLKWVRGERRYPVVDDREQSEARRRVLGILRSEEIPAPHDVALIALADACAVFDAIVGMDELLDLRPRLAEVARLDLLAVSMAQALHQAQRGAPRDHLPSLKIYGATDDVATHG